MTIKPLAYNVWISTIIIMIHPASNHAASTPQEPTRATRYGNIDALYSAPLPTKGANEATPIDVCSCFNAGWAEYSTDGRTVPATVPAPCGWCGTFEPPALRLPNHRLVAILRQVSQSNQSNPIGASR